MLKRPITYENFNDETVTEDFYFNLSKTELVKLDVQYEDGLGTHLVKVSRSENKKELLETFMDLILRSYGEKSADGKTFTKSDAMREAFSQTAAFDTLFIELTKNETTIAEFIIGVFPKEFQDDFKKKMVELSTESAEATPPTDTV